jgi:hypothetical protein
VVRFQNHFRYLTGNYNLIKQLDRESGVPGDFGNNQKGGASCTHEDGIEISKGWDFERNKVH